MAPDDSWKSSKSDPDTVPKHDGPSLKAEIVELRATKIADVFFARFERLDKLLLPARLVTVFVLAIGAFVTLLGNETTSARRGLIIISVFVVSYAVAEYVIWMGEVRRARNASQWFEYMQGHK